MWWTTRECPKCKGMRVVRAWPRFWRTRTCLKCHGRGRISVPVPEFKPVLKQKPLTRAEERAAATARDEPEPWTPIPIPSKDDGPKSS